MYCQSCGNLGCKTTVARVSLDGHLPHDANRLARSLITCPITGTGESVITALSPLTTVAMPQRKL